ncbi:MAG: zf-TFIIB domain-containing protein [Patescibacteria group bacterium]
MSTVCPACHNVEMRTVSSGATQYETCDSCGGAFFDFQELAAEAKSAPDTAPFVEKVYRGDDLPDRLPTDARPCSRCGTQMSEREYSYDS